jgi:hypothetical protein
MQRFKKHAVWVILIAIIVGLVLMFKARKVAAEPMDTALVSSSEIQPARPLPSR